MNREKIFSDVKHYFLRHNTDATIGTQYITSIKTEGLNTVELPNSFRETKKAVTIRVCVRVLPYVTYGMCECLGTL